MKELIISSCLFLLSIQNAKASDNYKTIKIFNLTQGDQLGQLPLLKRKISGDTSETTAICYFKVNDKGEFAFVINNNGVSFDKKIALLFDGKWNFEKRVNLDELKQLGFGEKNTFSAGVNYSYKKIIDKKLPGAIGLILENKNRILISGLKKNGFSSDELNCYAKYEGLCRQAWPLAIDSNGNIYVLVEGYVSRGKNDEWTPDILENFVEVFDEKGNEIYHIELPRGKKSPVSKNEYEGLYSSDDLFVNREGDIFYICNQKDGVGVYRLRK